MRRRAIHHQRERNILLAFLLNSAFALIEAVGGVLTNSFAIMSSALHDLGDSISLFSAYVSERSSHRLPDEKRTFGYRRLALLAAFVNANVLLTGSLLVLANAVPRLLKPEPVHSPGMLALSVLGVLFNAWGVLRLSRGRSITERILRWHLLEDILGWVAVAVVGTVLLFWDVPVLDTLLTFIFTGIILVNVWRSVRETANLLLEGVPKPKSLAWMEGVLQGHRSVAAVHDVHLWSLDGEQDLLSAHVVPRARASPRRLLHDLKALVRRRGIEHAVFELETEGRCAGHVERRIKSREQPRIVPSVLFALRDTFRVRRSVGRGALPR